MSICLQNVIKDVELISKEGIEVDDEIFEVDFYLGADWKFLATVCGIESPNCTHACIWCANVSISDVDILSDQIVSLRAANSFHSFRMSTFERFENKFGKSIRLNSTYFSGPVRSRHFNELVSLHV